MRVCMGVCEFACVCVFAVPSRLGIHRNGSLICCVEAKFKKDL